MNLRLCCLGLCLARLCIPPLPAAEPEVAAADLLPVPPTEPGEALKTFRVKPGFHVELVAAEPLIASPIALAFDENGRMFVVEMRDYPEDRDQKLGRIRMLEDTDGDGRFDKSTTYADHLPWPTAIFCYGGGVFVGATPDLLYLKDSHGDGVADVRQVVFTGFGQGRDPLNVQELFNGFVWGLDDRIHGVTSGEGATITSVATPSAKPLVLRGQDFAFDPRALTIAAETGGGQYGLSFDDDGRKFACNNSDHIRLAMYEDRYASRNPYYAMPGALESIGVDGPAAEIYRISPDERWRVIRTEWRVAGKVTGPVEGGGRPSGYFTAATGITIYRGDAWPAGYRGDAFIADCSGNLVHRKKLSADGVGLKAERPADEQKVEFLASTDNWFRPVQLANAPDGTLYVIDMYREIIEHPWSLPESIKKHLDLNSGRERGRIYRIVPDGFKQPKPPRFGHATTAALVKTLASPNGWYRDTAARLLYERQDRAAVPGLERLLKNSPSPLGRLHALHALDGLHALKLEPVLRALDDPHPWVREHAVRLSETFLQPAPAGDRLWEKLRTLTSDPEPRVRYQLAFTLGEVNRADKVSALAEIIRRDAGDSWMRAAVLSSLVQGAGEMFRRAAADVRFASSPGGREFLRQLVLLVATQNQPGDLNEVLDYIGKLTEPELEFSLVRTIGDGLQRARTSLASIDRQGKLKPVYARALVVANDARIPEPVRLEAVRLLSGMSFADAGGLLLSLLDPAQSQAIQLAAVASLGRYSGSAAAAGLAKRWTELTPRVRSDALTVLIARPERIAVLLDTIEAGSMLRSELTTTQVAFLRSHRDAGVRERAQRLFGTTATGQRQAVIDAFLPALKLNGEAKRGGTIFLNRCTPCHRLGGQGHAVGPDLASVKSNGKEKMLISLLDPNREVAPNYLNYLVETKDGESLLGLIVSENAASVTLRRPNGDDAVVLRSNIGHIQSSGQSLMPEGLEAGLTPQDLADLLEYISVAEPTKP